MSKRFPVNPAQPQRNCWGCDRYCSAADMACGNGSVRTPHPAELFGPDWEQWLPPVATAPTPVYMGLPAGPPM
jgi:hypothetical protein